MGVRVRYIAAVGAVMCLAATAAAGAANAHVAQHKVLTLTTKGTAPLATAITDPWLFNSSQEATAFAKTRAAGASYVRLTLNWNADRSRQPPRRLRRHRPDVSRLLVGERRRHRGSRPKPPD